MSTLADASTVPLPLTVLPEEENMFRAMVRKFARERIGPHVREMDQTGVFRKDILREMFELGLMGIEIPEEYGDKAGISFRPCWRLRRWRAWTLRRR